MRRHFRTFILLLCAVTLTGILTLYFTSQYRFSKLCDNIFSNELQSNTLTMHYILNEPENYGISEYEPRLGSFALQTFPRKASLLGQLLYLKSICKDQLCASDQCTYELLKYSLHTELDGLPYQLLEEPLTPATGIHAQLPILLAEYSFQKPRDVDDYLSLLKCIPEYFDSLIAFEEEKILHGLFMDEATASELIDYCEEFLTEPDQHFLSETFLARLNQLSEQSTVSKEAYLNKHTEILASFVFPAYEKLLIFLKEHKSDGCNSDGLFYYPNGTKYYAWLLRAQIGCDYSFEEIEALLKSALTKETGIINQLIKEHPSLLEERQNISIDTSNPAGLTIYLKQRASHDFPQIPEVQTEIQYVPASMEEHLSPAFYLVPPIDGWQENIIYLNNQALSENISFFTTLAHESYPGHLYQNVYENSIDTHPIRRLFYFGGYTEGWATYAEQCSFFYAPISDNLAMLLSTARAVTLNLYAHLDLYVHAYGWTEDDCTAYLKKYGITQTSAVHQMYLLIKQQPANYLKYYLGYLEICSLKEQARNCLGSSFDLKEFHQYVLDCTPAPFVYLEEQLKDWIAEYPSCS